MSTFAHYKREIIMTIHTIKTIWSLIVLALQLNKTLFTIFLIIASAYNVFLIALKVVVLVEK